MSTEPTNDDAGSSRVALRRKLLWGLVLVAAGGLLAAPAAVWATTTFSDVPPSNVHHDAIDSIADAGVTEGCEPGRYCPDDFVRRDQMASFLDRLETLPLDCSADEVVKWTGSEWACAADEDSALSGYEVVTNEVTVPAGDFVRDTATCPSGKKVLGGGAQVVGEGTGDFKTTIQESAPGTIGGGAQDLWLVSVKNNDTASHTVSIDAICVELPS